MAARTAKTPRVYLCSNTDARHEVTDPRPGQDMTGTRCPARTRGGSRCPGLLRQVAGPGMKRTSKESA